MKADKLETEVRRVIFVAKIFSLCLLPFCYYFTVLLWLFLEIIEMGTIKEAWTSKL